VGESFANIITGLVTGAVLGLVFYVVAKSNKKEAQENADKKHIVVHLPKIYFWVGLICALFFAAVFVLMLLFPNDTAEVWVGLIFWVFILLGLFLVLLSKVWKIHLYRGEDRFTYISTYGVRHTIAYADIVYCKIGQNVITLKIKKKRFFIDPHATNLSFFLEELRERQVKQK